MKFIYENIFTFLVVRKECYALEPYFINKIDVEITFCSCIMPANYGGGSGSQLLTTLTFGGIQNLENMMTQYLNYL